MFDNLDKSWEKRHNLDVLASFLFGLLGVGEDVYKEFHKSSSRKNKVNVAILLFIRSDIFSFIQPFARERDKLKFTPINWDNGILLPKVIEERFLASGGEEPIWSTYFTEQIKGIDTKSYLTSVVIPRPRDIIFLCKQAIRHAINHEHEKVQAEDIIEAEKNYSEHAYSALITETIAKYSSIEDFIIEFAGTNEIVSEKELKEIATTAGVQDEDFQGIIDLLCDMTFLGLEAKIDEFTFIYDDNKKRVIKTKARKVTERIGKTRYRVHPAFHSFLDIEKAH